MWSLDVKGAVVDRLVVSIPRERGNTLGALFGTDMVSNGPITTFLKCHRCDLSIFPPFSAEVLPFCMVSHDAFESQQHVCARQVQVVIRARYKL